MAQFLKSEECVFTHSVIHCHQDPGPSLHPGLGEAAAALSWSFTGP